MSGKRLIWRVEREVKKRRPGRVLGMERLDERRVMAWGAGWDALLDTVANAWQALPGNVTQSLTNFARQTSNRIDDRLENNDTALTATNLGTVQGTGTVSSLVMADAADWFRFSTTGTGGSAGAVSVRFNAWLGDLDLALFTSSGQRLGTSAGVSGTERISLAGLPAGDYLVQVYGYRGVWNPSYSLTIVADATTSSTTTGGGLPPTNPATNPTTGGTNGTSTGGSTTSGGGTNGSTGTTSGFDIQFRFQGVSAADQAIFEQAAARWESIIVGDLPNATYGGVAVDDLLIDVSFQSIDGAGSVLGQAGPDAFRRGSNLPYHGSMEFDSADMATLRANGGLLGVIAHEIGHVLGVGTLWESKGLVAGLGTSNPRFVGSQSVSAFNQVFRTNVSSVPLEATGGPGTRDAHWRESILSNELMTGWVGPGVQMPLSIITVASLADLGYSVNYAMADSFTPRFVGSAAVAAINASVSGSGSGTSAGATGAVREAGLAAGGGSSRGRNRELLAGGSSGRSTSVTGNTTVTSGMVLKTFSTAASQNQKTTGKVVTNALDMVLSQWSSHRSPWDQTGWRV